MHPILMTVKTLAEKTWKYDILCAAGVVVGYAIGWARCKSKLEDEYTKKVDKQIEDYKKRVLKKTGDILSGHGLVVPGGEEEMTEEEARAKIADGNFQTSSIEDFKVTPEEKQTPYHKMYKAPDLKDAPESMSVETTEEQIGRVDSEKMNNVPRTKSGKIKRGAKPASMDAYEDAPEEDRVHLIWYVEDDILADKDGDIWDEDDAFGDDLVEWKAGSELFTVAYSNYYAGKVFCIERKECSYSDIYEGGLDELLGEYEE